MSQLKAFISADIEGISGWIGEDESSPAAKAAMVGDVNAAIEGLLEAAPDADVLVADSHSDKQTIPPADLHDRASLLRGDNRPYGGVDGVQADTDVAFFIGYHGRPGSGGFLEHTYTGSIAEVRVEGHSMGEFGLNAMLLADSDIPVTLVTGDDKLEETVNTRLPSAEYVRTKTTRSSMSAICRPQTVVRTEIRKAAARAIDLGRSDMSPPIPIDLPMSVTVEYRSPVFADIAALWPSVERGDDSLTITYEADDIPSAFQFVRAAVKVHTGNN